MAARIRTGTVAINETYQAAWARLARRWAASKDSGLGRRHGRDGILKYTEPQTVAVQRLVSFAPPPLVDLGHWAQRLHRVVARPEEAGRR